MHVICQLSPLLALTAPRSAKSAIPAPSTVAPGTVTWIKSWEPPELFRLQATLVAVGEVFLSEPLAWATDSPPGT